MTLPLLKPGVTHDKVPYAKTLTVRHLKSMGMSTLASSIDTKSKKYGANAVKGVRAIQKKYKLVVDGIIGPKTWAILKLKDVVSKPTFPLVVVTRAQWGAAPPKETPVKVDWTSTTTTRVHHTVSRPGDGTLEAEKAHTKYLQRLAFQRGFNDISYNYLIYPSGRVHVGRGFEVEGAHTKGHNANPGVAFVGDYRTDTLTWKQKAAFSLLRRRIGVASGKLIPHKATYNTECPGPNVMKALGLTAPSSASAAPVADNNAADAHPPCCDE